MTNTRERLILWGLGAAIVLVSLSHLRTLTSYPPIHVDEPWFADAAWTWLRHGIHLETMHAPSRPQSGYGSLRRPFISDGAFALSFAILGLGLFPARLVAWISGVLLLLATFLVGRRMYGALTGALAALMLSLSPAFLQTSHCARPDVILAGVVMAGFGLGLLALEGDRWWAHLLAGLILGLGVDVHMNAIVFGVALGVCYLTAYGRQLPRRRGTWLYVGGAVLSLVYYIAVHILPDPATYFAGQSFSIGVTHAVPLADLSLETLLWSIRGEIARYDFYNHSLDLGLIGASLAYLLLCRRSARDRALLVFLGSAFAGMVLLVRYKTPNYAILTYPFLLLIVAETFVDLMRTARKGARGVRVFVLSLLVAFLVSNLQHYRRTLLDYQGYDYYAVTARIGSAIPPGSRVMGTPHWWLGLADYDYVSSANLTFLHYSKGYGFEEGVELLRPDFVILDRQQRILLTNENPFPQDGGQDAYLLPKSEFEGFLAERGRKVLEFGDRWHGRFQIYAIEWD